MIFEQIHAGEDRNFAYLIGDDSTREAAIELQLRSEELNFIAQCAEEPSIIRPASLAHECRYHGPAR